MRIAFCGKGGSGKTSLASLFIRYLASQGSDVLAIDGDINQHLGEAIGLDKDELKSLPRLGNHMKVLSEYVAGTNSRIRTTAHIIESTPAGRGSNFITFDFNDPVSQKCMIRQGNLRFIGVGGHEEHDVGATCYHKFTGAEGVFLNHLLDGPNEFVIGDMCAGADPFASSGLASRYDAIYLVLEPTLKSLAVYEQAKTYTEPFGLRLYTIANKVTSEDDVRFIEEKTGQKCAAVFRDMKAFRNLERGEDYEINQLDAETLSSLSDLKSIALSLGGRDWDKYVEVGKFFHKRAGDGWASGKWGYDVMEQVDPDFRYEDVMPSISKAA